MKAIQYSQEVLDQMREIVDNCMGEEAAYCQAACPMHTDVKGYVNLIAEEQFDASIQLIRQKLFLPASLGRVCAHPCEENCKRKEAFSEPMSIAMLKRYVADNYDMEADWDLTTAPDNGRKVAVIGAGPAGAQAAIDLRKKGYQVDIFEKLDVVGGMMRVGIPAYRLPRDIIDFEYRYLEKLGVNFHFGVEIGKDVTMESLEADFDAVVVAVGAHKGIVIPLEGHEAEGVLNAVDFLREVSLTGKAKIGKRIAVIGGGNVAIDVARSARRIGADQVHLICLEEKADMPAHDWEVEEALEEGVRLHSSHGSSHIAVKNGKVAGLAIQKCLSIFDDTKAFNPKFDESSLHTLEVDQVIFAVGQAVDSSFAGEAYELQRAGRFAVNDVTLQTKVDKVFVAGDATGRSGIVIEAMAEGHKAAVSVDRFLNGLDLEANREKEGSYQTGLETEIAETEENLPRLKTNQLDPAKRVESFEEVDLGYQKDQAVQEASRCLKCECKLCMKECIMLNDYCQCPKDLFESILETGEIEPEIPYSCNMCNQCTLVCPKDFKISERFFAIRKKMVEANNGKSPMKGHSAIEVHQALGFSKLFNTSKKAK